MVKADKVFSEQAREKIRKEILEANGNEVVFRGIPGDDYPVEDIEIIGYGNQNLATFDWKRLQPKDVVIHNHPSGNLNPSAQDIELASLLLENDVRACIINNDVTDVYIITPLFYPKESQKLSIDIEEIELEKYWKDKRYLSSVLEGFESREEQLSMAKNVLNAINNNKISIIEAGTGTGKSIAYLIPSILYAMKSKEKIVVSTYTINLQEQLFYKDIPILEKLRDLKFKASVLFGRSNFVCLRKAKDIEENIFNEKEANIVLSWLESTDTGLLQELYGVVDSDVLELIASKKDTCMRVKCPYFKDCFYYSYRRKTLEADIIIVNQHLLLSDAYIRSGAAMEITGILPPYKKVIIDEAHHIDEVAAGIWGYEVSYRGFLRIISSFYKEESNGEEKGILLFLENKFNSLGIDLDFFSIREKLKEKYDKMKEVLKLLFLHLKQKQSEEDSITYTEEYKPHFENIVFILNEMLDIVSNLEEVLDSYEGEDEYTKEEASLELFSYKGRIRAHLDALNRAIGMEEGFIYWFSIGEKEWSLKFHITPVKPGEILKQYFWPYMDSVILTSATLSVANSFEFYKEKIGIKEEFEHRGEEYIYKSPFNYRKQVKLYIPKDVSSIGSSDYIDDIVDIAIDLYNVVHGGILFLFTSYKMMKTAYERLKSKAPFVELVKQGDFARRKILEQMKEKESGIVFATASFWEGIDLPGKALRCLVIVRLPFPVPTNPIVSAISRELEKEGKSPFNDFMLPTAITAFRQGFGRLIRNKSDYGVFIVMDKRILTKGYGRYFLESIPPIEKSFNLWKEQIKDIERFFLERAVP